MIPSGRPFNRDYLRTERDWLSFSGEAFKIQYLVGFPVKYEGPSNGTLWFWVPLAKPEANPRPVTIMQDFFVHWYAAQKGMNLKKMWTAHAKNLTFDAALGAWTTCWVLLSLMILLAPRHAI